MTEFFEVVREYRYDGETHEAFFTTETEAVTFIDTYDPEGTSADLVIFRCAFGTDAKRVEIARYKEQMFAKRMRVTP